MAKLSKSCESRFRQNFKNFFDWSVSNKSFLQPTNGRRIAIAIALCFISKSGKKTPGMDWFWSVCAAAMNKGLEILGISIVDIVVKDALFLKAEQTFTDLISHSRDDVNSKYLYCGPKSGKKGRFQKSFCKFGIYDFDINTFRGVSHRQENINPSIGYTKSLLHNAAMEDRFIAMSGESPNMRLNNTDFKELLLYGIRTVSYFN